MERGQHDQSQMAVEALPPASRLGAVLGWTLLALGGIGLVAFVIASLQAHAAADALQQAEMALDNAIFSHLDSHLERARAAAAYAAYLSANAIAQQANVRVAVVAAAACLPVWIIPGVLYASNPQYLGGPLGGLLRRATTSARLRRPRPWRQIARRQGLGLMFLGIGLAIVWMTQVVAQLTVAPWWWLIAAMLVYYSAIFLSFPLIGNGAWWFEPRIASQPQREPEEP